MRLLYTALIIVGSSGISPGLSAQTPTMDAEALDRVLFPPELIMQHRRAIGLTDEQRDAISQMIQELQGKVVGLQWELLDDVQVLTETLQSPRVDLDRALDQLDAVLDTEKGVKQAHLELLIRIKNVLTADQQTQLERLRANASGSPPGGGDQPMAALSPGAIEDAGGGP